VKTTKYLLSIFFVFTQILIYAQKNQIVSDEFMYVDYDYMLYSKSTTTTSNCDCTSGVENFRFNWGTSFNTAFINLANLTLAQNLAVQSARNEWFNKQKNLIKEHINAKLGENFTNFNEAKDGLFLNSELKNVQIHSVPLLNKYNGLRSNQYAVSKPYLKELKLLELRKIEITSGNINNSSFKFLKVGEIILGDIKDMNALNIQWNKILNPLGVSIAKTYEFKNIAEKLNFLGKDFETELIRLKNNYYNTFNEWDQLNFMQVLLNYEEFKRLTSCGPCLFPTNLRDLYKFQSLDRTTLTFIEDYAIKNRIGGYSIFDQKYIDEIIESIKNDNTNRYVDSRDRYAEIESAIAQWEYEKEQAINNLLNSVDVSNFAVENLIGKLNITNQEQRLWLFNNHTYAKSFEDFLNYNQNSIEAKDLVFGLIKIMSLPNSDSNAINFIISALAQNKIFVPFDSPFFTSVNQYMDLDVANLSPDLLLQIQLYFTTRCAVLKNKNPNWSEDKILWEASKDLIHITLDGFGMIPVVGEIADLTNGVLYLIEGDGINATLSFAATVPIVGWGATTGKYVFKITASTIGTKVRLTWKVLENGVVYFGSSGNQLRKVLGITVSTLQAHHIMPWALRNNNVIQKAAKSGNAFHLNEALNGIPVASWRNQPNHNAYNNLIESKLNTFNNLYPNASVDDAYNFVRDLIEDVRDWVIKNPNSHLNNLVLP